MTPPLGDVTVCDLCRVPLDERDSCPRCHVHHGEPCSACGRRGYHADTCEEVEAL